MPAFHRADKAPVLTFEFSAGCVRLFVIRSPANIAPEEISMVLQSPKVRFQQPKYFLRIQSGARGP
jgi:hypothetical protein